MTVTRQSQMLPLERQEAIYVLAVGQGSVDVSDLATRYNVTTETIRRDLTDMQARGLLRRVHGGAVLSERMSHEPMLDARDRVDADEKLRIARQAVLEVPDRGSVIIDSGSTTQQFANVFPIDRDVHVVTNSLAIATVLSRRGLRDLTVLGGSVRTNTLAMVDETASSQLQNMTVNVVFMSCDGLSSKRGLTTPYRAEQELKRTMIERADRLVAMVDASKFGNLQMFSFAPLEQVDVLITDTRVEEDAVQVLSEHGMTMHRV